MLLTNSFLRPPNGEYIMIENNMYFYNKLDKEENDNGGNTREKIM